MVSLVAMIGIDQPQTLKLRGHLKNEDVTIVIDTGRTHNFLEINVEKGLYLFVYLATDIKLMVGYGKK